MTPAEELRTAAMLLRETAAVPYGPPWEVSTDDPNMVVSGDTRPWGAPVVADTADRGLAAWIALVSPALAEPLADLLHSIATVHEQPPCDASEACNRCIEPDPVIIDALRVIEELKARQP